MHASHRRSQRPAFALAVALAIAAALAFAPAASALSFGGPTAVSPSGEVVNPNGSGQSAVAMDAAGDAIVTWTKFSDSAGDCPCTIRAARRTAGGAFGAAFDVSTSDSADQTENAQVAMDSAGNAVVSWFELFTGATPDDKVYAAVVPASGLVGSPHLISGTKPGGLPQVAMDAAGDATVAWVGAGTNSYPEQVFYARRPAGGSFGTPAAIAGANDTVAGMNVAMSPDGHTAIGFSWRHPCENPPNTCTGNPKLGNEPEQVQLARSATAGGAFGAVEAVSPMVTNQGEPLSGPWVHETSVAIDDHNDVVVGYAQAGASWSIGDGVTAKAATSDGGGSFSPVTLGTTDGSVADVRVVLNPSREATALWGTTAGAVDTASRASGGSFGAPAPLATGDSYTLAASSNATGASGAALAALGAAGGTTESMSAAVRPAGGSFGAVSPVGESDTNFAGEPNAAIDKDGTQAVIAWVDDGGVKVALAPPVAGSQHTLTVSRGGSGTGSVTSTDGTIDCGAVCSHTYATGTHVTLTAHPAGGSTFTGWSGACSGAGACSITLGSDQTVAATFKLAAPDTKLGKAKIDRRHGAASFKFSGTNGATGFQCALVRKAAKHHRKPKPSFTACKSPKKYKHLKHGSYTFLVRAVNDAGQDQSPATKHFSL